MKMFQEKLCATRKKSNKSQKEFAELVEVSSKTIYRWEKGSSSPSIAQREYLSTKLNLPVKYFYDGIDVDITTGIILAETYGVPAVFLNEGVADQTLKFLDWYYSTGRTNIKMASSIQEALNIQPMNLPDLTEMRENIIDTFPKDLWERQ